jgi:hypothetical protein
LVRRCIPAPKADAIHRFDERKSIQALCEHFFLGTVSSALPYEEDNECALKSQHKEYDRDTAFERMWERCFHCYGHSCPECCWPQSIFLRMHKHINNFHIAEVPTIW